MMNAPRCGLSESSRHVVECKGTGTDLTFSLALKKLATALTTMATAPHLSSAIILRLQQWRKHGDRKLPKFRNFDQWGTQHVVCEQDRIGWYQFLLGRIARNWSDAQQCFIDSLQKRDTGRRWAISLIQKALDIAWDMWQQRNDINNNNLHPRRAEALLAIQREVKQLYRKGRSRLLPHDGVVFAKSESTLAAGSDLQMLQWISSVLSTTRRAAQANNDLEATMQTERSLMK
jgi:hypothetical protein